MNDGVTGTEHPIASLLRLWFGFSRPVNRRAYVLSGIGLALLKYAVDALIIFTTTGQIWTPWGYVGSMLAAPQGVTASAEGQIIMFALLLLLSVPFMWIGASMSIRRAADAGFSPWIGLLFFLPVVNYLMMLTLSILPTHDPLDRPKRPVVEMDDHRTSFILSAAGGAAAGLAMTGLSVFVLTSYAAGLFIGVPFCMGLVTAFLYNHGHARTEVATFGAVQIGVLLAGAGLLVFAMEGAICIAMAYPMAALIAAVGGMIGRTMALLGRDRSAHATIVVLAFPLLLGADSMGRDTPLREVISTIEIDAAPEFVWPNVVGFSELPPPSQLVFRLGIAYPMRARIDGTGVGAVRHCEFSTGPFVEPITRWEQPSRLSFDVVAQPKPMHEWSPYQHVNAPHLVDNMRSKRGEFRLIALPGNRTRLEGSTWYELEMFPQAYWTFWSDMLVHSIHQRVLQHIKHLSETNGIAHNGEGESPDEPSDLRDTLSAAARREPRPPTSSEHQLRHRA